MKPIGILLICAGMSVAQQNGVSPGPPLPYEDEGACPFEGCVYRTCKAWFKGRLYDNLDAADIVNGACDVAPDRCVGKIVERSVTTWWVQIQDARKRVAWSPEPGARSLRR